MAASRLGRGGFVLKTSHPAHARFLLLYLMYLEKKNQGEKPNNFSLLKARGVERHTVRCV